MAGLITRLTQEAEDGRHNATPEERTMRQKRYADTGGLGKKIKEAQDAKNHRAPKK